jgi:LysR family hydrogen peroxide-inducible transcriptional activator
MTISQLEYVVAVDTYKNFVLAAEKCFVTQPTLSMQIQKLEDQLGLKIFDRSKQPVVCTEVGVAIVQQARVLLAESQKLLQLAKDQKGKVVGILRLGIIPTLAPYLLPLFLNKFLETYPEVELHVQELATEDILHKLKKGILDGGILATPLGDSALYEQHLFHEPFVAYLSPLNPLFSQNEIGVEDVDIQETWILNEGHCFRNQVLGLCQKKQKENHGFHYESGSLETLKRLVELGKGMTILPELAAKEVPIERQYMLRSFLAHVPVREISMVTHRQFIKKKLVDALVGTLLSVLPEGLREKKDAFVVPL